MIEECTLQWGLNSQQVTTKMINYLIVMVGEQTGFCL